MSDGVLRLNLHSVRGTDSNSLLRLYDRVHSMVATAPSLQQRAKAEKTAERIAEELRKRSIAVGARSNGRAQA